MIARVHRRLTAAGGVVYHSGRLEVPVRAA